MSANVDLPDGLTQRWNTRRDRWVPAGALIRPETLGVDVLPEAMARAFVD